MRHILIFGLVACLALASVPAAGHMFGMVSAAAIDGFVYIENGDGTVRIYDYVGPGGDVIVPEILDGMSVTGIGGDAFRFSGTLRTISIPENVTSIGDAAFVGCFALQAINVDPNSNHYASVDGVLYSKDMSVLICCPQKKEGSFAIPDGVVIIDYRAFHWCSYLTSVMIPESVTEVRSWAFYGCSNLRTIAIPINVTFISDSAFMRCSALTAFDVDANNRAYTSVNGVLYNKTVTELIEHPMGRRGAFTVPGGVTRIGATAFEGCYALTSVTLPEGVTAIGSYAFTDCSALERVSFMGDAPMLDVNWPSFDEGITVYYHPDAEGFTSPLWNGLATYPMTVPAEPRDLSTIPGDGQVSMSWTVPVSDGGASIDHYLVYQDGVEVGAYNTTSAILYGLVNGQTYTFEVAADSSMGVGARSMAVTAVPSPGSGADQGSDDDDGADGDPADGAASTPKGSVSEYLMPALGLVAVLASAGIASLLVLRMRRGP